MNLVEAVRWWIDVDDFALVIDLLTGFVPQRRVDMASLDRCRAS
jgi:hypothetical protein